MGGVSDLKLTISTFILLLQKEIALYTASKINSEFYWFDIDGDVDPLFKVNPSSRGIVIIYLISTFFVFFI